MATYAEIEDIRDWFIDTSAEMMAKTDVLNGEEPPAVISQIKTAAEAMHQSLIHLIAMLDELLIQKKRVE